MSNHLYDALMAPQALSERCFLRQSGKPDLSFREFATLASRLANRLVEAGLLPGDRVVVQAPKTIEMVALYIATLQAGGVFLPLNTAYKRDELAYFIADATPRIVVCDGAREIEVLAVAGDGHVLTLNSDGRGTLTDGIEGQPGHFDPVPRTKNDLAALLYTSGTTGRSKGAMLTHGNLLSNARALCDLWQITSSDTLIHALPIFHTHGLFVALNTSLLAGVRLDFQTGFDLNAIFGAMHQSTMLMGVPTFYTRLLGDARLTKEATQKMRLFVSGSAPLLAETHEAFTARTGHRILERYGMTETNMITSNPFDGERRAGTVGHPIADIEVRLTNSETGKDVSQGEVGMIEVRGPNVFAGYWNMPEKTAAELRESGFFITGDLGSLSADGYLSIVGRSKDLIITGGYNVYPKEVEDVLNDIEGVVESAVFGVPDADFGEAIIAAVVPQADAALDPKVLALGVEEKLARFKHPRRYELIEALPRNTMGKVQKNLLRETYR